MSNEINYDNNPLNGVGLKSMLTEIVDHYGFEILFAYLNINCFKTNPSIDSSVTFLKKTEWAREKVEVFYLYQFKNLPRASSEQFALPPRDRIIPEGQVPGKPAELSFEDADRLREKRAKKVAARGRGAGGRSASGKRGGAQRQRSGHSNQRDTKRTDERESSTASGAAVEKGTDPWAKWRS